MPSNVNDTKIPVGINSALIGLFIALHVFQYVGLPVLLNRGYDGLVWLLLPLTLLTPTNWALIHESFHGVLLPGAKTNAVFGRFLCILFAAPFRMLRFGHLMHHRLNRTSFDRTEVYDPVKVGVVRANIRYYARILFGLYAIELFSTLLFFLPVKVLRPMASKVFACEELEGNIDPARLACKTYLENGHIWELRLDGLFIYSLLAVSFWFYGDYWPWLFFIMVARGFFISVLDNAPHYATPLDSGTFAYNSWLPRPLGRVILNFNLHRVHHEKPTLPWISLPACHNQIFDGGYLAGIFNQLKGAIPIDKVSNGPV